jgi:hypothetical protein
MRAGHGGTGMFLRWYKIHLSGDQSATGASLRERQCSSCRGTEKQEYLIIWTTGMVQPSTLYSYACAPVAIPTER